MDLQKRIIGPLIRNILDDFPAAVVTGARKAIKSTFLLNEFPEFKYITLDNFDVLEQAKKDPVSLLIDSEKIIIDEAQKAPEILSAVKLEIDRSKGKKNFLFRDRQTYS